MGTGGVPYSGTLCPVPDSRETAQEREPGRAIPKPGAWGKFDITSVGRGGTWESEEVAGQGGETGVMETTGPGAEECRRGR